VRECCQLGPVGHAKLGEHVHNRPGVYTGADFQRPITWFLDCSCWKVTDPEFQPAR